MSERVFKGALVVSIIALILAAVVLAYTYMALSGLRGEVASMSDRLSGLDERLKLVAKAAGIPIEEPEEMKLIAAAREEGKLVFYSSLRPEDMEWLLKRFKEKYPFIATDYVRASGEKILARIMTEAEAGKYICDVVQIDDDFTVTLDKKGLLMEYRSPESKAYPPEAVTPTYVAIRRNAFVVAYNTKLVPPERVPKTWKDLLDPWWKGGKIGIEMEDYLWMAVLIREMGEAEGIKFFEGLAAQAPRMTKGHTETLELVAAGEILISPTVYLYKAEDLKKQGAPIDYVILEPAPAKTHMLAILKNAPHPNAAKLFFDFMLSEEIASAMALGPPKGTPNAYEMIRPGIKAPIVELTAGKRIAYITAKEIERYDYYKDLFNKIFGLA
jgi:iron(III) transport system substrate-binding protein